MNKNLIIAGINEAKISTLENSIIGTVGLATCVGILLYSEEHKKAIVAHVSNNCGECVNDTLKLIEESKLDSSPLKYIIIPGYYMTDMPVIQVKTIENITAPINTPFIKPIINQEKRFIHISIKEQVSAYAVPLQSCLL